MLSSSAPSVSTVSRSSTASKERLGSNTTDPPPPSKLKAVKAPAPCMSGEAGNPIGPALRTIDRTASTLPSVGYRAPGVVALNKLKRSSTLHMTPFGVPVVPPV